MHATAAEPGLELGYSKHTKAKNLRSMKKNIADAAPSFSDTGEERG